MKSISSKFIHATILETKNKRIIKSNDVYSLVSTENAPQGTFWELYQNESLRKVKLFASQVLKLKFKK